MRSRKLAALFAALFVALATLAGCGGGSAEEEPVQGQQENQQQEGGGEEELPETPLEEPAEKSIDEEPIEGGGRTTGATLAEVAENPSAFFGQTVTVSGDVASVIEPTTFVIVSQETVRDAEPFEEDEANLAEAGVLVVSGVGRDLNLTPGQTAKVMGPVRRFDVAEFEQEIGVDLIDDLYADWADRPAIVAQSVERILEEGTTVGPSEQTSP